MPCKDNFPTEVASREVLERRTQFLCAMLCQTMHFIEHEDQMSRFRRFYSAAEAGQPVQELDLWWRNHKESDDNLRLLEARDIDLRGLSGHHHG